MSPLYSGLNPGHHHLIAALHHLLVANDWLPLTLVIDDSPNGQKLGQAVGAVKEQFSSALSEVGGMRHSFCLWHIIERAIPFFLQLVVVTVQRTAARRKILTHLNRIQQTISTVIAFCCDVQLATSIFREANHLNMLKGQWVWMALEGAAVQSTADRPSYPVGLLGLVSQQMKVTKHTMKGSLLILHSALHSMPIDDIRSWNTLFTDDSCVPSNRSNHRNRLATKLNK